MCMCVCVCVHVQARARACVRMCAVRVSVCGRGCMVYGLGRLTNLPLHSSSYLYLGTKLCCRQSTLETDYPNRTNDLQSTSKTVDSSRELFHPHLNMETEQVVCSLRLKHTVQVRQASPPPSHPKATTHLFTGPPTTGPPSSRFTRTSNSLHEVTKRVRADGYYWEGGKRRG